MFINLQKILVLNCYSTRDVLLFHHVLAHYSLSVCSPCILRAVTMQLTCTRGAFLVHSCVLSAPLALIVTRCSWSVFTHSALCTIIKRSFFIVVRNIKVLRKKRTQSDTGFLVTSGNSSYVSYFYDNCKFHHQEKSINH